MAVMESLTNEQEGLVSTTIERYDNHKLQTWRLCDLKGYWRHHRHYVQNAGAMTPALEYGIWYHHAMDTMYKTHDPVEAATVFQRGYTPIFEEFEHTDTTAAKHTVKMGCDSIIDYWKQWEPTIKNMEVLGIEKYFAMDIGLDPEHDCEECNGAGYVEQWMGSPTPIPGEPLPRQDCVLCSGTGRLRGPVYCGVVDKVFRDKRSGQVVGMDHKTASMLSGALISSFKISQQFRGYMYWLKRHSPWAEEAGDYFYFDMILKTKTKYNDNKKFFRDTTLAQKPYLDEWWDDMVDHVKEVRRKIATADETGRLPRQDSDACQKFNRICNFYDLCSQPRETRDTLAEQLFETEVWDPLNRDDDT